MFSQRGSAYANMVSINVSIPLQLDRGTTPGPRARRRGWRVVEQMRAQREEGHARAPGRGAQLAAGLAQRPRPAGALRRAACCRWRPSARAPRWRPTAAAAARSTAVLEARRMRDRHRSWTACAWRWTPPRCGRDSNYLIPCRAQTIVDGPRVAPRRNEHERQDPPHRHRRCRRAGRGRLWPLQPGHAARHGHERRAGGARRFDRHRPAAADGPCRRPSPQGEDATRRHITAGIKAGDVDPATGSKVLYYHDPMVPGNKFDSPAKSPFMDMMLVPVYADSGGADGRHGHGQPAHPAEPGPAHRRGGRGDARRRRSARWAASPGTSATRPSCRRAPPAIVEKLHVRATLDRVAQGPAAGRALRARLGRGAGGVPVGAAHAGQRSGAAGGRRAPAHAPGRHERGADRAGRAQRRAAAAHHARRRRSAAWSPN